jgi:hypothetical protein
MPDLLIQELKEIKAQSNCGLEIFFEEVYVMHLEYDINGRGSSNILNKDSLLDFDE